MKCLFEQITRVFDDSEGQYDPRVLTSVYTLFRFDLRKGIYFESFLERLPNATQSLTVHEHTRTFETLCLCEMFVIVNI